jgi:hypothetical protein
MATLRLKEDTTMVYEDLLFSGVLFLSFWLLLHWLHAAAHSSHRGRRPTPV